MLAQVILAIDDAAQRKRLRDMLSLRPGTMVSGVRLSKRLWERLGRKTWDLIVLSEELLPEPKFENVGFIAQIPEPPLLALLCSRDDPAAQAAYMAAGASAVLSAELPAEAIYEVVGALLDRRPAATTHPYEAQPLLEQPRLTDFVSQSPVMQAFMEMVYRIIPSDVALLIQGETGVGKERLARAVHGESPRGDGPFIAINCGALPESLLETELYGHEEGAFTGASRSRRGAFELAHGGTIFLDEIGEMPLHLQVKLLRALQEKEIRRLGGEQAIPVDVRVMAATNRDLDEEVAAQRFRRDLYYRLSVVTLTIPPLRERREDVPELVESYLAYLGARIAASGEAVAPEALEALMRYDWPGNVRELINVIERAMLLCEGDTITLRELPAMIAGGRVVEAGPDLFAADSEKPALPASWAERPLKEVRQLAVDTVERVYLQHLLEETRGRIGETAARAGIDPRSLYAKMRRFGLRKEAFKGEG